MAMMTAPSSAVPYSMAIVSSRGSRRTVAGTVITSARAPAGASAGAAVQPDDRDAAALDGPGLAGDALDGLGLREGAVLGGLCLVADALDGLGLWRDVTGRGKLAAPRRGP